MCTSYGRVVYDPVYTVLQIVFSSIKAHPDRRDILAATAKLRLRNLSWNGTYKATSGSHHTGAKKSRKRLRNCTDLFIFAACNVFVAVAAYNAVVRIPRVGAS